MTDLDRLAELERAATPAPWMAHGGDISDAGDFVVAETSGDVEAELIAILRNAAPDLIAAAHERDLATERIALARKALIDTGYFTADEVSDDVAPRIIELDSARCRELEVLATALGQLRRERDEARAFRKRVRARIQSWSDDPQARLEAFGIAAEDLDKLRAEVERLTGERDLAAARGIQDTAGLIADYVRDMRFQGELAGDLWDRGYNSACDKAAAYADRLAATPAAEATPDTLPCGCWPHAYCGRMDGHESHKHGSPQRWCYGCECEWPDDAKPGNSPCGVSDECWEHGAARSKRVIERPDGPCSACEEYEDGGPAPDNVGDGDRWEDPRDTVGGYEPAPADPAPDELAEIDTTEAEFDAMAAQGEPVEIITPVTEGTSHIRLYSFAPAPDSASQADGEPYVIWLGSCIEHRDTHWQWTCRLCPASRCDPRWMGPDARRVAEEHHRTQHGDAAPAGGGETP